MVPRTITRPQSGFASFISLSLVSAAVRDLFRQLPTLLTASDSHPPSSSNLLPTLVLATNRRAGEHYRSARLDCSAMV